MTTRALQALDELPAYTLSGKFPLDALARLATAAGYGARGDDSMNRAQAEHHLGMALGILSRGDNRQAVTVNEVGGVQVRREEDSRENYR